VEAMIVFRIRSRRSFADGPTPESQGVRVAALKDKTAWGAPGSACGSPHARHRYLEQRLMHVRSLHRPCDQTPPFLHKPERIGRQLQRSHPGSDYCFDSASAPAPRCERASKMGFKEEKRGATLGKSDASNGPARLPSKYFREGWLRSKSSSDQKPKRTSS